MKKNSRLKFNIFIFFWIPDRLQNLAFKYKTPLLGGLFIFQINNLCLATPKNLFQSQPMTIQGFKSNESTQNQHITITASMAEISLTLKHQRLYNPIIDIKLKVESSNSEYSIKASSKQALFRGNDLIFIDSTEIIITKASKKSQKVRLYSEKDPIIFENENQILRGSRITYDNSQNKYVGRSFKLDLFSNQITWLSELKQINSSKIFKLPYQMKLFNL